MRDLAHPLAAVVALLGLGLKLTDLFRDPRNPAVRAICTVLACLAGAVLIGWEPVYVGVDSAAHVPNLAKLIEHGLALTAAAAIQVLYLYLDDPRRAPRRARVRWAVLGGVLLVMVVMFRLGDFDVEAPDGFADVYAEDPHLLPYLLVYLSYLALAMIDIWRSSTRYARHAPDAWLRAGIRLLSVGSVIGLAYVLHKAVFVGAIRYGLPMPWPESTGSRTLILAGIAFVTTGLALPSVAATVADLWRWPRRHRLHRRLHPLWLAVTQAVPEIVLYPTDEPQRDRLILRGLRHALYRRVVEILDGALRLQPYADRSDVDAACADSDRDRALAAAVAIASGIARKRSGAAPSATATATAVDAGAVPAGIHTETATETEAAATYLAEVAEAFERSAAVADLLREPAGATAPTGPDAVRL